MTAKAITIADILSLTTYRPPTKFREGNLFSRVCHSVHRGGGVSPLYRAPALVRPLYGHVQTSWTWISLYNAPRPPRHVQTCSLWSTYGWQAGGLHPTWILSCFNYVIETDSNANSKDISPRTRLYIAFRMMCTWPKSSFALNQFQSNVTFILSLISFTLQ